MSSFITPEVGKKYEFDGRIVTVERALKKRFWQVQISWPVADEVRQQETIGQKEWAAKAQHVGAQ